MAVFVNRAGSGAPAATSFIHLAVLLLGLSGIGFWAKRWLNPVETDAVLVLAVGAAAAVLTAIVITLVAWARQRTKIVSIPKGNPEPPRGTKHQISERADLLPDEKVLLRRSANRRVSERSWAGGDLFVTPTRIFFRAHRFESALRPSDWGLEAGALKSAERFRSPENPLRDVLRVEARDGSVDLFLVNKLDSTVELIRDTLAPSK